jgi:hypothetical protein
VFEAGFLTEVRTTITTTTTTLITTTTTTTTTRGVEDKNSLNSK